MSPGALKIGQASQLFSVFLINKALTAPIIFRPAHRPGFRATGRGVARCSVRWEFRRRDRGNYLLRVAADRGPGPRGDFLPR
jgi:hypothetical protein